jgi:hypothetical protein
VLTLAGKTCSLRMSFTNTSDGQPKEENAAGEPAKESRPCSFILPVSHSRWFLPLIFTRICGVPKEEV